MRKIVTLILFAAAIYGNPVVGQAEKKIGIANEPKQEAQRDERGTKASPLVIDPSSMHTDAEAAEEQRKDTEQKHTDRWIIGLTLAISICALFQVIGVFWQVYVYRQQTRLMLTGLKVGHQNAQAALSGAQAAKVSADASQKNVQIFIDRERAHLTVRPTLQERVAVSKGKTQEITLYVRNLGLSRAIDVVCYASAISGLKSTHPAQWPTVMERTIIQPTEEDNDPIRASVRCADEHDIEELSTEIEPDSTLFFIEVRGMLTYKDIFRLPHEYWFRHHNRVKSAGVRMAYPRGTGKVWFIEDGAWEKVGADDNRET
jgi:hypothetical protein